MSILDNFIKDEITNVLVNVVQGLVEHYITNKSPNSGENTLNQHIDLATANIINKVKEHPNWREEDMH